MIVMLMLAEKVGHFQKHFFLVEKGSYREPFRSGADNMKERMKSERKSNPRTKKCS